jgi:hypothetical protein
VSGVTNMAGGISSIARLRSTIKALPLRIRSAVAKDAEAILNSELSDNFAAGRTVYDTPRPLSVARETIGQPLSLVKTGKTKGALQFVTIGTILRASLGTKYAKYLVGKYKVMPNGALPAAWRSKLETLVREYAEDLEREAAR